jgi:hypothetical protein
VGSPLFSSSRARMQVVCTQIEQWGGGSPRRCRPRAEARGDPRRSGPAPGEAGGFPRRSWRGEEPAAPLPLRGEAPPAPAPPRTGASSRRDPATSPPLARPLPNRTTYSRGTPDRKGPFAQRIGTPTRRPCYDRARGGDP